MTRKLTRRHFFGASGAVAVTALMAACGTPAPTATAVPKAASAPAAPPTQAPAKAADAAKPADTSKPAPAAAPAKADAPGAGQTIAALGRNYLANPGVKGDLTFSNCWAGARIPLVDQWIKDFIAIYPGVKIANDVGACAPLRDKQVASIAAGAPANVLMIQSSNTAFFAEQQALDPIDDLMKRDAVGRDWFYKAEYDSRTWDAKSYGLPNVTGGASAMLWVNKGLLKKIGVDPEKKFETWQDLESLVEPAKKAGLLVLDPMKGTTGHMQHTYANGGKYWNDELTKITWNGPEGVEAMEFLLKLVKAQVPKYEDLAIASEAGRKDVIQITDWAPEKFVTMINGSWGFFNMKQQAAHIDYSVFPFPRNASNANSKGFTANSGGWMFSIPKAAKDKDAAWEFIKFTTTSERACWFVKQQNRPSPVLACNEDPELSRGNPYWKVVTQDLQNNVMVPHSPVSPQLQDIFWKMEEDVMFQKVAPKQALDEAAREGQKLLDDWNSKRKK